VQRQRAYADGGLQPGTALVLVCLAVVTLPPQSTAPTVAGCCLVGCSVVSGLPLRSRAVTGVSLHVCVSLGPVLASHAPSPPAAATAAWRGRGSVFSSTALRHRTGPSWASKTPRLKSCHARVSTATARPAQPILGGAPILSRCSNSRRLARLCVFITAVPITKPFLIPATEPRFFLKFLRLKVSFSSFFLLSTPCVQDRKPSPGNLGVHTGSAEWRSNSSQENLSLDTRSPGAGRCRLLL